MGNAMTTMATSRQYWALRCATGIDYRGQNLTMEQASQMIAEANKKSGYVKSGKVDKKETATKPTNPLIQQFENEYQSIVAKVYQTLTGTTLQTGGIVTVEGGGEKPREYVMCGRGCGFAMLRYDKRNKKMQEFDKYVGDVFLKNVFTPSRLFGDIKKLIPMEYQKKMEECGNPIDAVLYQDIDIKSTYLWECARIAGDQGIKCSVDSWLD